VFNVYAHRPTILPRANDFTLYMYIFFFNLYFTINDHDQNNLSLLREEINRLPVTSVSALLVKVQRLQNAAIRIYS